MIELIPVTRAHGLQDREINKMSGILSTAMNAGYSLDKENHLFGGWNWVLMQLAQLACLCFKKGIINLIAAGIHDRADGRYGIKALVCHGIQRRHGNQRHTDLSQ